VRRGEAIELVGDRFRLLAHRLVAADQVGVGIDEQHVAAVEPARRLEIEEHGAAAEERLDVADERARVEAAELRQQLALSTRPFQERAG
jgi:hypothetical protein